MTTAPTLPLLDRGVNRPPVPGERASDSVHAAAGIREARRADNLERRGFGPQLRCECALPSCRETFPAVAQSYRGTAERFIIVPAHLGAIVVPADIDDGTVVRAADRFFVVELNGSADHRFPPAEPLLRAETDRGRLHLASWSSSTSRPSIET